MSSKFLEMLNSFMLIKGYTILIPLISGMRWCYAATKHIGLNVLCWRHYLYTFLFISVLCFNPAFAQNTLNLAGLSSGSPAATAYSLRKLSTAYNGNAIQVRRSSNNDTTSIGFTASGILDTAALKTFVGSGNGFVRIWFDQSGRGNHALQTTDASQPRIVTSGVVERRNNIPSVLFSGSQTLTITNSTATLGVRNAQLEMNAIVTPANTNALFVIGSLQASENYEMHTSNNGNRFILNSNIFADANNGASFNGNVTAIVGGRYNGTQAISRKDGIDGTGLNTSVNANDYNLVIGARAGPQLLFNGYIRELLLFPANINSDRAALEANQKSYNDLPSLSSVTIQSSNSSTAFASTGDTIRLSFTASKTLQTPTATIAGVSAAVTNTSGNNWQATLIVTDLTPRGVAAINISYADLFGNTGTATSTTNASTVTINNRLDLAGLSATSPAASAYSLRKLRSGYTGNAIQVRRSSNNDTLSIGFTANGDLDTAALKTFVGSGNGFIRIWFDQSGRGNNALQTTDASQPRIVTSGVVERRNNIPSVLFSGSQTMTITNTASVLGLQGVNLELNAVVTPANNSPLFVIGSLQVGGYEMHTGGDAKNRFIITPGNWADANNGASYDGNLTTIVGGRYNGTQAIARRDGTDGTGLTTTANTFDHSICIGSRLGTQLLFNGNMNELLLFPANLNSDRIALEANQNAYYINNTNLSNLVLSTGTLSPTFAQATTAYTANVANATGRITLTPTTVVSNSNIEVRVNAGSYAAVTSGSASGLLALNVGSNTIDVRVTAQNATTKTYTITVTYTSTVPTITSFTPTSGVVGATVTITGTNFNTTPANNIVFFGATRATVSAATATSLTVTVPTGSTYGRITVLNTITSLAAYSLSNFTPVFTPSKTDFTASDIATKQDFATGTNPWGTAIGDLDGDGKPDIAVANRGSSTVSVYRNTSTIGSINGSSFAAKQDFATNNFTTSVSIGDIDGDGKLDLVVGGNGVSILRNTATSGVINSSSFAAKQDFESGVAEVYQIAIGDLDGDGKLDLAMADIGSVISVLRNTSTSGVINSSSFAAKQDFTAGGESVGVAIGDIDRDGKPDMVATNEPDNTISVFRNTATSGTINASSFATQVVFATGSYPGSPVIGDLDGDGKPDLAIRNYFNNSISVFRNTATSGSITSGSFATRQDFSATSAPQSMDMADMTGDGKPDLVVVGISGSPNTSILRNTSTSGTISFAAKQDYAANTGAIRIAVGDLDGDGRPDLAATNYSSGTISVSRNTTNANLSALAMSSGALSPTFASDTTAYTSSVTNATSSVTVTPTRADANATIEVRVNSGSYASVTSGSPSGSLSLNVGSNTINVRVTGQDGITQKIYTITVTRTLVSNLAGLTNNSLASTAFSLRKLSSNYTGSAIQVRRSSNNDTTSIGFTTNGDLDTATLKTFVGGGNAFVSIWYDQSGHGNNAVQTTQSRQPRIVSSGIIDRKNKIPCLFFTNNESMQVINSASVLGIVNSNYEYNAVVTPANSSNNFVFGNIVTAADYELQTYSNGVQFIPTASPAIFARVTNAGGFSGTQTAVIGARLTGTQAIARKDGSDGSPEVAGPSPNNYIIMIGSRGITPSYNGVINEAFIFPSNLQTNDRLALERNQRSYHFNIPGLSNLVLSTGTLSPVFNYLTYSYTTTVSSATSSITVTPTAILGNETITVNGANVTSGAASGNITLVDGLNTITVVVTAFDGVTTQSYTVAVTRISANANLSNLTLSTGTLTPSFASDSISYRVRVSNTTASITVTPTRAQANATIEARVNGGAYASVTSGSPSGSLALNLGSNTINVRVTAQDAVTQKIYTLTVTRSLVSDLAGLTNNSPSSTAFSLRKLSSNYTGSAIQVRRSSNNDTTSIGFTTNGDLDTATLKTFVGVGNAFVSIWYDQSGHGNNAVQTTQSRQPRIVSTGIIDRKNKIPCLFFTNNENMQVLNSASVLGIVNSNYEYNAVVTPANSSNNFVFGNIVTAADYELQTYSNGVQFIPIASPAVFARSTNGGGFSGTQTAVIGARLTGTQAIARKDGGDGSPEVAGTSPNNYIIMIGSRGNSPSYNGVINEAFIFPANLQTNERLTLERNQRSYHFNIPGLSNLVLSTGTLSPVFNYLTYSYTTTVSSATSSITVTPTAIFGNETITVNGANVTSGVASGNISLVEGLNTITVVVTAFDGVTTQSYTVAVTRQSSNANLSNLTLSTGTLTPSFALDTISYTAIVNNTTSTITVTPTRAQANATIEARVNGGAYASVTSGSPSGSLALNVGSNTIDVRVTAQDGIATKTYTVTVTRRSINEFYSKSTGAPNLTSTWGTNIDGSGAEPIGFTSNNQVFLLSNANPGIMTANWTVSGTGSNIIVGNGTLLQTLSTGTFLINATVDVANLATLTVQSISTFTLGTAATGSTVVYDLATGGQSISAGTYHHLTLNNTSGINSAGGNLTVNGTLTTTAGGTLNMGNTAVLSGTLSTITNNGTISTGVPTTTSATPIPAGRTWGGGVTFNASTGAQTVVAGTFNNLTMSNTAAPNSLGGNITVGGTFAFATSGNKLNLGSNTLTLNGSISNMSATACFTANGLSNLTIGGSGALGTNLFLDQTTIGITNRLNNFTYNRNGQTITLGDTVEVIGMVTPTAGTLATGNKLKLISNATRDAGILTGTGSYITGNVIVERYIPASNRNWRFMASPVAGATLADWQGEMHITGAGGATNGFDPTLSNQPSVFSYNETLITGGINSGWTAAANISDALTVGKGYRIFVRGDRTAGRLTGQISTQNAITVTTVNAVNTGNINMNPTFSSSGTIADDGWNLLGNPYPCAIDWNAFHSAGRTGLSPNYSGTDYAHLDAIVYTLDAGANTYSSYNAFSGATIGDLAGGIIPSSAAFWVKTSAPSPSMIIKEIYKTNTTPGSIFKTGTDPKQFSIKLKGSEFNTDEAVFKYVATATTGFDAYDIAKLYGADVNIASIGNDGTFLSANYRPFNGKCDSIMLSVGIAKTGEYTMEFLKHEELGTNLTIAVVDLLTNTIIDVSKTPLYVFFADINKPETFGNNRFKLIIGNAGITSSIDDQIAKDHKPYLYVYPTHTDGFTKVFTNKTMLQSAIYIYDVTGKLMTHLEQPNWIQNQLELDLNNYQQGMYFIYIMKEGKTIETLKCVKE